MAESGKQICEATVSMLSLAADAVVLCRDWRKRWKFEQAQNSVGQKWPSLKFIAIDNKKSP